VALDEMGLPVGPSWAFLLGADGNGRDVFVRTLYGAQISLLVGIPATTAAMIIGTLIGTISGFIAGRVDRIVSQAIDVAMSFPFVVTALSLLSLNRGDQGLPLISPVLVVILVIALFSWTYFARLTRGLVLELRSSPMVEASMVVGASKTRIILLDILPNILPTLLVYWAVQLPANIVAEATLSFLGVGIQAPVPSWGNMIAEALVSGRPRSRIIPYSGRIQHFEFGIADCARSASEAVVGHDKEPRLNRISIGVDPAHRPCFIVLHHEDCLSQPRGDARSPQRHTGNDRRRGTCVASQ
jgi:ABC-type dipeptide/oligopeptide/nickel transport system permease subunit